MYMNRILPYYTVLTKKSSFENLGMTLVDVLLFINPDPDGRKVPDLLDPDPQHWGISQYINYMPTVTPKNA